MFRSILCTLALASAMQTATLAHAQSETTLNDVGSFSRVCPKMVALMGSAIKKAYPVTANLENKQEIRITTSDGQVSTYKDAKFNDYVDPSPDGNYWLVFTEMDGNTTGSASLVYPVDSESCYTLLSTEYPIKP